MNHSLTSASGKTHAKMAFLAVAVSLVFVAVVSASGFTRSDDFGAKTYGAVVKARTTIMVAGNDRSRIP